MLEGLDDRLLNWFLHALWGNLRGDIIRALYEANRYEIFRERVGVRQRNLFSLGGLTLMAGRELVQTPDGWRFFPHGQAPAKWRRKQMEFNPVAVKTGEPFTLSTAAPAEESGHVCLYQREPGEEENSAMAEAFNALLRNIPM